ncbi:MAG: hypothetical protein CVV45_09680 [Spirochaetae bacterium HGW-Spirochaetae-10]|nr:MAG: hypothetical protein CVV45_09680 [Spirochaetae bacterium HGW-Spirochaetae-10]
MAGIQNIDFSQKLSGVPAGSARPAAQQKNPIELSRILGWGLAGAILVFTAGILAGLKIAELRSIEKNLVKYPDGKPTSFANAASEPAAAVQEEERPAAVREPARATLIIRIGAFSAKRAGELARSLNQMEELDGIRFQACKGVEDLNPDRSHVFAVPVEGSDSHRLFAGCYATKEDAKKALEALKSTGVASLKESKLYELE